MCVWVWGEEGHRLHEVLQADRRAQREAHRSTGMGGRKGCGSRLPPSCLQNWWSPGKPLKLV